MDLANDLKGKTLLLPGIYVNENVAFDAEGNVSANATPEPFSVSGIHLEKVHLAGATHHLEGHRCALINTGSSDPAQLSDIRYIATPVKVHLTIVGDPTHPEGLQSLAAKIFAASIDDALAGKQKRSEKPNSSPSVISTLCTAEDSHIDPQSK